MQPLRKITEAEKVGKLVGELPVRPTLRSPEMQQYFDRHPNLIGTIMNENATTQDLNNAAAQEHLDSKSNPHAVTKAQVGLGNADNTSDANKPISTAQAAAIALKVDKVAGKQLSTNDYDNSEKAEVAKVKDKANIADVLTKTNSTPFTPVSDYNPATMKFVTDSINTGGNVTQEQISRWDSLSNPNLLINGDFQVWQRGTSFSVTDYTADRWKVLSAGDTTKITTGLRYTPSVGSIYPNIVQILENHLSYIGKTLTASCRIKALGGSTIGLAINTGADQSIVSKTISQETQELKVTYTIPNNATQLRVVLYVYESSTIAGHGFDVNWVKLEIGDQATPFVPRLYAEELALCQRYVLPIRRFSRYRATDYHEKELRFTVPTPVTLRTTPIIVNPTNLAVRSLTSAPIAGFAFKADIFSENCILIIATKASHGITDGQLCPVDGDIFLDAEL